MTKDLTGGHPLRVILLFSFPLVLGNLFQQFYALADTIIVGRFCGVSALASVGATSSVNYLILGFVIGACNGFAIPIAQLFGARDLPGLRKHTANAAWLCIIGGVVLTVVTVALTRPLLTLLQTPADILDGTATYIGWIFAGIPAIFLYNMVAAIMRALGDSKTPLYFLVLTSALNIGLDLLFVIPLKLGVLGAALATDLSQVISGVGSFLYLKKHFSVLRMEKEERAFSSRACRRLLGIGAPIALQDGLIQVSFILITIIVNRRGLTDAAAVGIVEKIISFIFLVPSSMLSTVSALGAQNLGAGKPRRARQVPGYALCITAGFGLIVSLIMQGIAPRVVALFTPDAAVAAAGGEYLRGYIWDSVFAGLHFSFSGYFCALGKSGLSFLHNITAIVLVRIPGAWLMSTRFPETLYPMGLATAFGSLLSAVICVVTFAILTKKGRAGEPTEESGT